jgi:hypothetical protein
MPKERAARSSTASRLGSVLEILGQVANWAKGFMENLSDHLEKHVARLLRRMMGLALLFVLMAVGSVYFLTGLLLYIAERTGASVGLVFGIGGAFLFLTCALILALRGK